VQALILAGGEGTRLRPLTTTVPKPVLPLANRPFISYMLDWLSAHGTEEVVLSCGFLASEVQSVLAREAGGTRVIYATEQEPLGTAGAVKFADRHLGDRFVVLNGDILTDFDLSALQSFHDERGAQATIALVSVDDPSAYGLVRTNSRGEVSGFLEKPRPEDIDTSLINAGTYVLERQVLGAVPEGTAVSLEREVFPELVDAGLYGLPVDGYWMDIGTPERYLQANYDILDGKVKTVVEEQLGSDRLSVAASVVKHPEAQLVGPAIVGEHCRIDAQARVGGHAVIGDGCRVEAEAVIERSVLASGVTVGSGAVVSGGIIGADVRVGAGSRIEQGAVVGEGAVVAPRTVVTDGERLEPASGLTAG
jgi:mannose-1-phosphate guanylyltransferase